MKILSYALLAAYIAAGSSTIETMLQSNGNDFNVKFLYTLAVSLVLALPAKFVKTINNGLFMALMAIVGVLIVCLATTIRWSNIPLFGDDWMKLSAWCGILPVLFTSFGFQVLFHTLTDYCEKDAKVLKKVFFLGSLLPVFVYLIWTSSVLGAIHENAPDFYLKIMAGGVKEGELVKQLSLIAKSETIQFLIWWIAILAIITSILGVGLGLKGAIDQQLEGIIHNKHIRHLASVVGTMLLPYLVVILIPNAFISALSFAGMILVVIAILLPIYLLNPIKDKNLFYQRLRNKAMMRASLVLGFVIIGCEIINLLF